MYNIVESERERRVKKPNPYIYAGFYVTRIWNGRTPSSMPAYMRMRKIILHRISKKNPIE